MRRLFLLTLLLLSPVVALAAAAPRARTPVRDSYTITMARSDANVSVDLDFDNVTVRDALKRVFDQVQKEYVVDADVPESTRVTVRARSVKLGTALDLVAQAAGVNWAQEVRDGKPVFRFGKSLPAIRGWQFGPSNAFGFADGTRTLFRMDPSITRFANPSDLLYHFQAAESRSTFTCPHCKGQATVVGQRQQPKCAKCGRTFQADWQFCPVDGTKRPPTPGEWRFCPLCGKEVENDKAR